MDNHNEERNNQTEKNWLNVKLSQGGRGWGCWVGEVRDGTTSPILTTKFYDIYRA